MIRIQGKMVKKDIENKIRDVYYNPATHGKVSNKTKSKGEIMFSSLL